MIKVNSSYFYFLTIFRKEMYLHSQCLLITDELSVLHVRFRDTYTFGTDNDLKFERAYI